MGKTNTFPLKKLPSKEQRHQLFGSIKPSKKIKPIEKEKMADLQNVKKDFLFDLDAVGVSNVKHPVTIYSHTQPMTQTSIGSLTFSSSLKQNNKGTNMSRFTEQLRKYHEQGFIADFSTLKVFTKELAERLEQDDATIELAFPWFFERKAPETGMVGMNHADVTICVTYSQELGYTIHTSLSVSITTLCPCSKEISEYSAHNQRGIVTMEVSIPADFNEAETDWKKILLEAAESNASARLHPVLKRPDEKTVTEQAYENPRFVEDMVRLIAADLYELPYVSKFKVMCRNEESIHMHDAVASVSFDKQQSEIE